MTRLLQAVGMAMVLAAGAPATAAAPPAGGTVSIEPVGGGADDPALRPFRDAAGEALAARGFTVLDDPGHAAWVGGLTVTREDVGTSLGRVAGEHRPAPFAGAGPAVGAGVSIPLGTGASQQVPLRRTRLDLSLRRRDGEVVWHGSAVTVRSAGTAKGADAAVATDLARAAVQAYPTQTDEVVGVP